MQLVVRRSVVGIGNAQVESQVAADLPVIAKVEEGVIFFEAQFGIALCDDVNQWVVVNEVAETVKDITPLTNGRKMLGDCW